MYPENDYRDFLEHHGILGQRWGVRRYQNENGSLTSAGKKHYSGLRGAIESNKVKGQIKKALKNVDEENPEIAKINQKMAEAFIKSQEYKNYEAFTNYLIGINNEFQKQHPGGTLILGQNFKDLETKVKKDYFNKMCDLGEKHAKQRSKAVLKNAGIPDTEENVAYAESILLKNINKSRKSIG